MRVKRGTSKWPLGRVWGGIRGKLRGHEVRNGRKDEREGEENGEETPRDDEEDGENHRKTEIEGNPGDENNQKKREKEERVGGSEQKVGKGSPRGVRGPASVERSGESSASGEQREGAVTHEAHRPPRERGRRRDGANKPTPNPKPTRLKGQGSEGDGSESEGVKFSSLSGSLKLEVESALDTPKESGNNPQRQQRWTNVDERKTTMKSGEQQEPSTTPQKRRRKAEIKNRNDRDTRRDNAVPPSLPTLPAPTQSPHTAREKPPLPSKPVKLEQPVNGGDMATKLRRLQEMAVENDYYGMFGVESTATTEDLARVRREKSRQLHPDHFAGQSDRQERCVNSVLTMACLINSVLTNPMYVNCWG